MADELDEEWAKRMAERMLESGEPLWLVGKAHCIACDFVAILVCPSPIALEPNAECSNCHKMLMVFDRAEEMKLMVAKEEQKGRDAES